LRVSRVIPAPGNPVSTGSIAIAYGNRIGHRAMGALERAAAVAIFSLGDKTCAFKTPPSTSNRRRIYFVKLQCVTTQELKGLDGQFPFPLRALSGRQSAPHPIWI
jgi:hypothetical protein